MKFSLNIFILLYISNNAYSQDSLRLLTPSPEFNKTRFIAAVGVQAAGYGGSLVLLSNAWYKEYDQTSFHSFDDSREWLQMDKAGHLVTTWYLGRIGIDMFEWAGVFKKKAIWYGTAGSFLYLTGIEVMDGFSRGWGFSWSDLAANATGTGFIIGQKFLKSAAVGSSLQRGVGEISLKFSFHQTSWTDLRPSLLGDSVLIRQLLKDYNGQTYWMSLNISSFLKTEFKFPKWLNIAIGYGGEGMISGKAEYVTLGNGSTIWVERYRQYYISLDIDMTKIKTRSHFLKSVFEAVSFIKIPAPALEMSKKGVKFHPFYY